MGHRIIAYSNHVASFFERSGLATERIRVIPNGVSFQEETSASIPNEPKGRRLRLAFCGAVVRHKGPHLIIEALDVAKLEAAHLLLLGETPDPGYVGQIRERASAIPGLTVEFGGPYEPREMPDLLKETDYVIVPSLVPEAGPIVPREALALGIPTIVSDAGALPEAIGAGENGLIFPVGRAGALGGILRRLSRDRSLGRRLRQGAGSTAVSTVAAHAAQVTAVYGEAVSLAESSRAPSEGEFRELAVLLDSLEDIGFGGPNDVGERMRRWVGQSHV